MSCIKCMEKYISDIVYTVLRHISQGIVVWMWKQTGFPYLGGSMWEAIFGKYILGTRVWNGEVASPQHLWLTQNSF